MKQNHEFEKKFPFQLKLLETLFLSDKESKIVQRFLATSKGSNFLAVSEILRRSGFSEEATDLLVWGCHRFPKYSAGKIALAKNLFELGFFGDARGILLEKEVLKTNNTLGKKLLLKLAVLEGNESLAKSLLKDEYNGLILDQEMVNLCSSYKNGGFALIKSNLLKDLRQKGITVEWRLVFFSQRKKQLSRRELKAGESFVRTNDLSRTGKKLPFSSTGKEPFSDRSQLVDQYSIISVEELTKKLVHFRVSPLELVFSTKGYFSEREQKEFFKKGSLTKKEDGCNDHKKKGDIRQRQKQALRKSSEEKMRSSSEFVKEERPGKKKLLSLKGTKLLDLKGNQSSSQLRRDLKVDFYESLLRLLP